MRIIRLEASNVKRLKVVDITPTTDVVEITGRNANGKSSLLDAIWWALAGKDAIQDQPIRRGEDKAHVKLTLGDIVVERKLTRTPEGEYTTRLTVRAADGASYGQAKLDDLVGALAFDPLKFMRMDKRAQFDELCRISKLEIDIDEIERLNAADFSSRRDLNRDAKALHARAGGITIAADLPPAPIDERALLDDLTAATEHNATIENRRTNRALAQLYADDKDADVARLMQAAAHERKNGDDRIADLKHQIAIMEQEFAARVDRLEQQAAASREDAAATRRQLAEAAPLPDPIDLAAVREKLSGARTVNAAVAKRIERDGITQEAERIEKEAHGLTERIQFRDAQKSDAIAAANLHVPGLGFGAGIVTYNGLPLSQASDAEQLRVSCAIAMANNPELRVIRVRDGSLLDDDGMKILAEMAREKDFQVWVERLTASGDVSIVMEEGEVRAADVAHG